MWARIGRFLRRFFRKTRMINNEPLNRVSSIVIILVDIFILVNVFNGLDDISHWFLSPDRVYPCYADFQTYRQSTNKDKDYQTIRSTVNLDVSDRYTWEQNYRSAQEGHLGSVFSLCLDYARQRDRVNNPLDRELIKNIDGKQSQIANLERTNQNIRASYDSTLLEKIAGQEPTRSINTVSAEKAKQELDRNNTAITNLKQEIAKLKSEIIAKPESVNLLNFIRDDSKFQPIKNNYQRASFWYPSIQFIFQALFLIPLVAIALLVHNFAQQKGYGLIALITWNLLAIFLIPLIIKILQFLQVGVLFNWIFNLIKAIFGSLLFLVSYVYIFIIPIVGFLLIKLLQNQFIFNPKIQADRRVQSSCCMNCGKKIRSGDAHCPHCGYHQYSECPHCHQETYKNLPYCRECGHPQ